MNSTTKKQRSNIYKGLTIDEIIPVVNEPWKMTQEKILRNHNKMVRNFNQLLAHLYTLQPNHPEISYGHEYDLIGVDEMTNMTPELYNKIDKSVLWGPMVGPAILTSQEQLHRGNQLLTKQFLRQLGWYCRCVCPIPVQKEAIELCKDCNKPIWDNDND